MIKKYEINDLEMHKNINNELKLLIEKYIYELQIIKNHIDVKYINTLKINTSNKSENTKILKTIKNDVPMIYIIRTNENITIEEIESAKEKLKTEGFGMFRINCKEIPNDPNQSKCLYVGSSKKLRDRLKQHIGLTSKTTYALHLNEWWRNKKIEIEIYEIIDFDNMQLYEDCLWQANKPILGREGKR